MSTTPKSVLPQLVLIPAAVEATSIMHQLSDVSARQYMSVFMPVNPEDTIQPVSIEAKLLPVPEGETVRQLTFTVIINGNEMATVIYPSQMITHGDVQYHAFDTDEYSLSIEGDLPPAELDSITNSLVVNFERDIPVKMVIEYINYHAGEADEE